MMRLGKMLAVFALVLAAGTACSERESVTAPPPPPDAELLRGLTGGLLDAARDLTSALLPAVVRLAPLESPVGVEQVIGPDGGVVRGGGVVLTVPRGALRSATKITMVIPAGAYVEAEFYPHGLEFEKDAKLEFDVWGTSGYGSAMVGTYFRVPILRGLIQPAETFDAVVRDGRVEFWIRHFSRYAPAYRGYTAAGG